ncbi:hypothetical protein LZ31DRAFT_197007 [Colletotrichum somersetense]|nr:hypothetical protein LZ31DRAFT_197007 [Colletotrichum somersetense]
MQAPHVRRGVGVGRSTQIQHGGRGFSSVRDLCKRAPLRTKCWLVWVFVLFWRKYDVRCCVCMYVNKCVCVCLSDAGQNGRAREVSLDETYG